MPTPTVEEYLEAIHTMACEDKAVIGARLAEALGVSPPTVTSTLQRMARDGLVSLDKDRQVHLTDLGRQAAENLLRRHRLIERLLVDVLGMDWHDVHDDACRLEHALSPAVERRLAAYLGNPTTCPHGNPIPGTGGVEGEVRLCDAKPGARLVLRRVAKQAESQPGMLLYLNQQGLRPGVAITVRDVAPFNGPVLVFAAGREVALGRDVAAMLWVTVEA